MKANEKGGEDERLSRLLREWRVEVALPPRLQERVWRRIERSEQVGVPFWTLLQKMIDVALPRPKVAFAFVTGLAVLGVAAGAIAGEIHGNHLSRELGEQYIQSVDPYRAAGGFQ